MAEEGLEPRAVVERAFEVGEEPEPEDIPPEEELELEPPLPPLPPPPLVEPDWELLLEEAEGVPVT